MFSNTQYRCPDPVPEGEDVPPLYSDLAYCDCDGCRNGAAELNTCVDCRHNNDDDE